MKYTCVNFKVMDAMYSAAMVTKLIIQLVKPVIYEEVANLILPYTFVVGP